MHGGASASEECTKDEHRRLCEQLLTASGKKGLEKLVSLLLGRGADVSHARKDGWTCLMAACSAGHHATAELLLAHKADVAATALDGFTALLETCTNGHCGVAELLIRNTASVSQPAGDGTTPLILASLYGHADVVGLLLRSGASLMQARPDGFTAIRAACGNGHARVATLLFDHYAQEANTEPITMLAGEEGRVALGTACANGHLATTSLLLEHGMSPDSTTPDDTPVLLQACMAGRRDVASLLISYGANIDNVLDTARRKNLPGVRRLLGRIRERVPTREAGETRDIDELVSAIEGRSSARSITSPSSTRTGNSTQARHREQPDRETEHTERELMSLDGDTTVDAPEDFGEQGLVSAAVTSMPSMPLTAAPSTALDSCADAREGSCVDAEEADVDNLEADTPADVAEIGPVAATHVPASASDEPRKVVCLKDATEEHLIASEIHVDLGDADAHSSASPVSAATTSRRLSMELMTASSKGLPDLVTLLLDRGADTTQTREDGWTPLMAACSAGHFGVAELLLDRGADARASASDGFTALLEACTYGHLMIVRLLLEHNADPSRPATDGTTPLILASLHGHVDTVSLLLDHGAAVQHQKTGGFTAFRAACGNGHVAVAKLLIGNGATEAKEEGAEALISACANGQVAVARLLIEGGIPATCTSADGTTALMKACLAGHREVASLLVASGADVDAVLDAARRQNSLSGVRRVLSRVKQPLKPVIEETRDVDELVRQIEGPKVVARQKAQGRMNPHRIKVGQHEVANATSPSNSSSSTSSDSHAGSSKEVQTLRDARAEDDSLKNARGKCKAHATVPAETTNCVPSLAPFPPVVSQAPLTGLPGTWVLRTLPAMYGRAKTYYTIEVLCSEHSDTTELCPTMFLNHSFSSNAPCNASVMTARCKGWPVAELTLIPLDSAELAEASYLVERGIPYVAECEPVPDGSPPLSVSSSSSSLPDRDAVEEYAEWCAEVQRRCSHTAQRSMLEGCTSQQVEMLEA